LRPGRTRRCGACAQERENERQPWRRKQWLIPPKGSGDFVWRMEAILDVDTWPSDPARPLVCLDEMPDQRLAEVRASLPPEPAGGPGGPGGRRAWTTNTSDAGPPTSSWPASRSRGGAG
jgi:hypothetical protein